MGRRDFDMLLPVGMETMTEKAFQRVVVEIGAYYGFTQVYHTAFSMKSQPGFPDLAMFNPEEGGSIYLEVKTKKNKPTQKQLDWLDAIRRAGVHAYIAHPAYVDRLIPVFNDEIMPPLSGTGTIMDGSLHDIAPVLVEQWRLP